MCERTDLSFHMHRLQQLRASCRPEASKLACQSFVVDHPLLQGTTTACEIEQLVSHTGLLFIGRAAMLLVIDCLYTS